MLTSKKRMFSLFLVFILLALFSTSCACERGDVALKINKCEQDFGVGNVETAECIMDWVDNWDYGFGKPKYSCYDWYIEKHDIDVTAIGPIEWNSPDS